jgi:lipopolysaccharide heptosyltransferase II
LRKLLVINPFGIGDVLFTTPAIRNIKLAFPESFIGYWCNERVQGLLAHNSDISKIFALSRGDIKKIYQRSKIKGLNRSLQLFLQLKKEKFEVALDYSLDHRYSLVAKLAGIKKRIGFNYRNRGRFLTQSIPLESYSEKHMIEYYLELLQFISVVPEPRVMTVGLSEKNKRSIDGMLSKHGISSGETLVGIVPGAGESWGKDALRKHWPASSFAALIDEIIEKLGIKVLLLGNAAERPIADQVRVLLRHNAAVADLVGKTSLEELSAVIKRLKILVTNDGGPLHMAVALGVSTVSLFGPVDSKVYGPYPHDIQKHIVLKNTLECSPCYKNFRLKPCINEYACLKEIEPQAVFRALISLMKKEGRNTDHENTNT